MFESKAANETNPDKKQMYAGISKRTTAAIDALQSTLQGQKEDSEIKQSVQVKQICCISSFTFPQDRLQEILTSLFPY